MEMTPLLAFDDDDLIVMSAHLEGASVLRSNIAYLPQEKRFVLVAERHERDDPSITHLTGLHFERVERVMTNHLPSQNEQAQLKLIGMTFEMTKAPSGVVVLMFEDQRAIRLDVECLEAVLADLPPSSEVKE